MAYDTEDTSIKAWDCTNGLSDVAITDIAYCEAAKRVIIVYDNGNIDLLSTEDDDYVVNLAQLKNSSLQGKEISSLSVHGTMAYVATGFGVVVIDVENAVIRNTYQLGTSATACVASDDAIYVGTSTGILKGLMSKNLQDKSNWTQISSELIPIKMAFFDGHVWVVAAGSLYYSNSEGTAFSKSIAIQPQYIATEDNKMIAGTTASFFIYTTATSYRYVSTPDKWTDVHSSNGMFWVSGGTNGLQAYTLEDKTFTQVLTGIKLNSPMHDYSYHLRFEGNRLHVAGGSFNYSVSSLPGTAMIYDADHTWVNFDSESVAEVAPNSRYKDVTDIEQDPNDASHHFVGTARSGLYEFRDAKCVAHYGVTNSPLISILPNNSNPDNYVVANGIRFDDDGNLWVLNPSTGVNDTIIRIMRPNGSWAGLQYDELNGISNLDNLLFDSRGWAWMSSLRMTGRGIFCLDYNGTPTQRSDDRHMLRSTITNQDGTTYQPDQFYCMAEDVDGSIWIGTTEGPFHISSPEDFFSTDFTFEQVKVSRNDGSGLADYLLSSIPVRAITVDGAGRKWFGTMSNGVYLISADCQEQIYHFTTDNSPLPSNDIDDIAINGSTGEVFFATSKGLCSFVADATDPVDDISDDELFVYPNPVMPDYSGPIAVRGLTQGSEVKIVAPSGQIIYSGYSNGGTFTWNGCNQRGSRVASGVYLIIASNADGSKAASTKVAVIR